MYILKPKRGLRVILKHKIIDKVEAESYGNHAYYIVRYDQVKQVLTIGGKARFSEQIRRFINEAFFIEDADVPMPEFNQRVNIRWTFENVSFEVYNSTMDRLRGAIDTLQIEKITRLNRIM